MLKSSKEVVPAYMWGTSHHYARTKVVTVRAAHDSEVNRMVDVVGRGCVGLGDQPGVDGACLRGARSGLR